MSDKSSGTRLAQTKGLTGEKDETDEDGYIIEVVTLTLDIHTGGDAATTAMEVERLGRHEDVVPEIHWDQVRFYLKVTLNLKA